ncbi:SOS response-associated peptidase [Thalassospira sp. MA62]|nr:SOS response-associated peptidase [Thalassospira sp. MA62]
MCSRFDLNADIRAFQVQLGLDMEEIRRIASHQEPFDDKTNAPNDAQNDVQNADRDNSDDNAAFDSLIGVRRPTDPIAVIVPKRQMTVRNWGLMIDGRNSPLINARAETLDQKPTFRPLLTRRCLIPASGWYEWRKEGRARIKNRITLPDHQPFLFAGLENGHEAVIVTCAPSKAISHIHDRMPAVIGPNHLAGWLDPNMPFDAIRHMLGPLPDEILAWQEDRPRPQSGTQEQDRSQIDLFG